MALSSQIDVDHYPIFPASGSQQPMEVRTSHATGGKSATGADVDVMAGIPSPTPRIASGNRFEPRRSNQWAIQVGYWLGRGHSAKAVAAIVGEGTSEGTVKGQLRRAGLCGSTPRQVVVPIEMPSWQRDAIAAKAAELGVSPDVLIMRVLESAIVLDDLYEAVTDGRYGS